MSSPPYQEGSSNPPRTERPFITLEGVFNCDADNSRKERPIITPEGVVNVKKDNTEKVT